MPRYSTPFSERFWNKVQIIDDDDSCWPWMGSRNEGGYGICGADSPTGDRVASRVAWILTFGPVPDGLYVLHHCDYRPCCRPSHLWLGTYLDNARDREAKGQRVNFKAPVMPGEAHPLARLTDDDVRAIRRGRAEGVPALVLAERYGVNRPTIYNIEAGRRWQHVLDDVPLPIGTGSRRDKLTEDAVCAIRAAYASGTATQEAIAKRFGISRASVSLVVHRHTWQHVE